MADNNKQPQQQRGNIDTGRSGGIGSAISAFNQAQSPTEQTPLPRVILMRLFLVGLGTHFYFFFFVQKVPIKLPKEEAVVRAQPTQSVVQPDVIPTKIEQKVAAPPTVVPPPAAFTNDADDDDDDVIAGIPPQSIYANVHKTDEYIQRTIESTVETAAAAVTVAAGSQSRESTSSSTVAVEKERISKTDDNNVVAAAAAAADEEHIDPIYQNQEDISEYIEDTGIRAVALYDYQAAADDEISFDPDDLITHIEQVR